MTLRSIAAAAVVLGAALATACNRPPESKEAIRQAVIEHLQKKSGLDPNAMDIQISTVSFAKDEARATVSFRPKNQPDAGLEMSYILENKNGKWEVKGRGQSAGGGSAPHAPMGGQMPGGQPGGAMPGGSGMPGGAMPGGALPPGHPPVKEGETPKPPPAKPNPPAGNPK